MRTSVRGSLFDPSILVGLVLVLSGFVNILHQSPRVGSLPHSERSSIQSRTGQTRKQIPRGSTPSHHWLGLVDFFLSLLSVCHRFQLLGGDGETVIASGFICERAKIPCEDTGDG